MTFLFGKKRTKATQQRERGSLCSFPSQNKHKKYKDQVQDCKELSPFKKTRRVVVKESLILSKIYDLVVMPSHKTRYAALSCHNKLSYTKINMVVCDDPSSHCEATGATLTSLLNSFQALQSLGYLSIKLMLDHRPKH